jgi:chemotaxis protein histidine kinase CheA
MNINFNIGFLKTVQNALMESLKKSKENIKSALDLAEEFDSRGVFISNSNKEYEELTALTNKTYEEFHKANGALKMVKLEGLVALVTKEEEMAKGFGGFIKRIGENEAIINSLATLLEVTQNVIYYVEQLTQGKNDEPLKLFKDYKKLIEANSHANISVNELNNQYEIAIKELFYPRFDLLNNDVNEEILSYFTNANVYTDTQIANTNDVLSTVQQKYSIESQNLLKLIQPVNLMDDLSTNTLSVDEQIASLKKLVDSISALKINKSTFIYSNFVSAFFDIIKTVNQNDINQFKEKSYASVEKIVHSYSDEIASLINFFKNTPINVNYQLQNIKPNYDALKEVSFFVCHKVSLNDDLYALKAVKSLDSLIGLTSYVQALNSNLDIAEVQKNPEVVTHFENVLIDLKEEVMVFGNKNSSDNAVYEQHMKKLSQLSDKSYELSKLIKIDLLQRLTQSFSNFVKKLHQNHITENLSEELSLYVVFLDNFVQNYLKNKDNIYNIENNAELEEQVDLICNRFDLFANKEEVSNLDIPKLDVESKASEQEKTIQHIFEELYNDLLIVEEIMDQFFRTEGENIEDIQKTIKPLINAQGVLKITQNLELSEVVAYMVNVFNDLTNKGVKAVEPQRIYNSANGLGGLLLYISAVKDGNKEEAKEVFSSLKSLFKDLDIKVAENINGNTVSSVSKSQKSVISNEVKNSEVSIPSIPTISTVEEEKEHALNIEEGMVNIEPLPLPNLSTSSEIVHEQEFDNHPITFDNEEIKNQEEHNDNLEVISHLTQKSSTEQHLLNDKDDFAHAQISHTEVAEGNEELVDIYLEEANLEVFPNIESALEKIEELGYDKEQLTIIRRAYHTLKGSGRMVNLNYLGEIAWLVEQTLNAFLNEDKPVPSSVLDVVKKTKATLEYYFEELNTHKKVFVDVKPSFELVKEINPQASLSSYVQVTESHEESNDSIIVDSTHVSEEVVVPTLDTLELDHEEDKEHELTLEDVLHHHHDNEETQVSIASIPLIDVDSHTENHSTHEEHHVKNEQHVDENDEIEITPLIDNVEEKHSEEEHHIENEVHKETQEEPSFDFSKITLTDVNENGEEITHEEKSHEIDISNINIEDIAPIHHDEVEVKAPTSIEIEGESVNLTVYDLFKAESEELIRKLKNNIQDNNQHDYILSEEFLRASHTLGSISRSVNLTKLADVAQGLELIAKLSIEKSTKLNSSQLELIEIVVEDLEVFKNIEELHEDYVTNKYNNDKDIINELEEELNNHDIETVEVHHHEYKNSEENIHEINPITISHEVVEEKQNNHHEDDESMKEIDMEKLFQRIAAHIDNSISELKDELNGKISSLEHSLEEVKEEHSNLLSKIENVKSTGSGNVASNVEEVKEELNDLMTKQQELIIKGFNSVKKDLAHINGEVKKKSAGLFSGLFGKK